MSDTAVRPEPMKLSWWVSGDTNAFFGLGFNTLVNVLVLSGLCLGVVRVHLAATRRADVAAAVDRAAGHGEHPRRILHRPEAAGQHPGRARRAAGGHGDRLDRRVPVRPRRGCGGEGHRAVTAHSG